MELESITGSEGNGTKRAEDDTVEANLSISRVSPRYTR